MYKWAIITLVAVGVFMVILLGLGYLLSENEKSTTLLKNQLAEAAQLSEEKTRQQRNLSDYPPAVNLDDLAKTDVNVMKIFEKTLINNLTCVSLTQCKIVTIKFKNINCQLASNIIGASKLKKIATESINMTTCPIINAQSQLACEQNICTLTNNSE